MGTPPFCHSQVIPSSSADLRFRCEGRVWLRAFRTRGHPASELCLYAAQVHGGLEPFSKLPLPGSFVCVAASLRCACAWGANLTITARLCAQEASSTSMLSIPNGRICQRQLQVRPAARFRLQATAAGAARSHSQSSPVAGSRATSSTRGDETGRLQDLLVSEVSAVPALHVLLFVCRVELSCVCVSVVSFRTSECMVMGGNDFHVIRCFSASFVIVAIQTTHNTLNLDS